MKRAPLILVCAVVLGLLLGASAYYWRTAPQRAMLCCERPELEWLKQEFLLNDAQFARVGEMHDAYLANCAEMCNRIDGTNALIRQVVASNKAVTPELETLLTQAAELRTQCQRQMLEHIFNVSREMPPEQGKRYLQWVQEQVFTMPHEQSKPSVSHSTHGH
jgi:hypothetical protein